METVQGNETAPVNASAKEQKKSEIILLSALIAS